MGDFTEVARAGDLAVGRIKKVVVNGHELLLARTAAGFFCAGNRCPHLGGDLSLGTLSGAIVTCPDHRSEFDLATGAVVRWTNMAGIVARLDRPAHPPRPLKVYEAKVEGDRVLVRLS